MVNSDGDVFYTKIDLRKILHMRSTHFVGLGKMRFPKIGLEDGVFSISSLDVGIAIICFAGFMIGMALCVCDACV